MGAPTPVRFRLRTIFLWIGLLAVIFGIVRTWPFVPREAYKGVRVGMTEAEVIEVMGRKGSEPKHADGEPYYWSYENFLFGVNVIEYSPDGRVVDAFKD